MEIESITKQSTHETPYTTQQQFQYFKASSSQVRSKLFTTVIFSCSSQIHSSLEGQQGASEIRYQTFSEKQTTLLPTQLFFPQTHFASPMQHTCIQPSALQPLLGRLSIFFLTTKDFQHFSQQERIPILTDVLQCLMSGANHTSSQMKI